MLLIQKHKHRSVTNYSTVLTSIVRHGAGQMVTVRIGNQQTSRSNLLRHTGLAHKGAATSMRHQDVGRILRQVPRLHLVHRGRLTQGEVARSHLDGQCDATGVAPERVVLAKHGRTVRIGFISPQSMGDVEVQIRRLVFGKANG